MTNTLSRKSIQAAARWTALILVGGLTLSAAGTAESLVQPLDATAWRRAVDLSGVGATDGKTRVRMIIFFDANCPFCATLWSQLHAAGTIRGVRWVPVAYFDSSSLGRQASILLAKDPVAALDTNFRLYDRIKSAGGARVMATVPAEIAGRIQANGLVWEDLGAMTPLIIYRNRNGTVQSFSGLPDQVAFGRMLADLAPSNIANYQSEDAGREDHHP